MVRPAAAVLALLLLPATGPAQQSGAGTHTVEPGNTLWNLAQVFYGDPHQWTRIFEANRHRIQDPDLLDPGLVLEIPRPGGGAPREPGEAPAPTGSGDVTESVRSVAVLPAASTVTAGRNEGMTPVAEDPVVASPPQERPDRPRTIFYPEPPSEEPVLAAPEAFLAFSEDDLYQAHWLAPPREGPARLGTLTGLASEEEGRHSVRPFDRVRLAFDGDVPPLGTRLQAFRPGRLLEGLGRVMTPTGTLTLTEVTPEGAVATVEDVYLRMAPGDLIRGLPLFPLTTDMVSRPVDSAQRATIVGFGEVHQLQSLLDYVFLGSGAADGVRVGDVFEVVLDDLTPEEVPGGGSVQVVSVHQEYSTAMIVTLENPVFQSGVVVRLSRRLQ